MSAQEQTEPGGWRVFHGTGSAPETPPDLHEAPPWRRFGGGPALPVPPADPETARRRLGPGDITLRLRDEDVDVVNAALLLRRPLLITGPPGVGKSTLAHLISRELGLGRVLEWSIVSRTALRDGLYTSDAMGRAQAIAAWRASLGNAAVQEGGAADPVDTPDAGVKDAPFPISRQQPPVMCDFITLGPLGTALLAHNWARVLLVDELDKSDIDLPNDLLHVLENGSYEVPELVRDAADTARVRTDDSGDRVEIRGGRVECREFPVVVITRNGEREFPAAFRRRCLPLEMRVLTQLFALMEGHIMIRPPGTESLVDEFVQRVQSGGTHSLDQLLNAVQMTTAGGFQADGDARTLVEMLLRDLAKGR
ncbi:AAA family ATPase [Streptomyces chartreusis]